jgi:hypothetical protein
MRTCKTPIGRKPTSRRALLSLIVVGLAAGAYAEAYYASSVEMIETASAIAIVQIAQVEAVEQAGERVKYGQKALASVEQVVKGELPDRIALYGDEDFICAQVHLAPGKFLVFLRRDGDLWVGVNWELSVRPIRGDEVQWYGDRLEMKWVRLASVLQEIRETLERVANK